MWDIVYLPEAESERLVLPKVERNALIHAVEKLEAFGPQLGYPHTSAVQGFTGLRELRPRAGRSPWRALYRRVGDVFVLAAVGPEAQGDQLGIRPSGSPGSCPTRGDRGVLDDAETVGFANRSPCPRRGPARS